MHTYIWIHVMQVLCFTHAHVNTWRVHPGFHAYIHPHMHTSHHNTESLPAALPTCKQPCSVDDLCLLEWVQPHPCMHAFADELLQQIKHAWVGPATSLPCSAHNELSQQIKHALVGPAISLPCSACMHEQMSSRASPCHDSACPATSLPRSACMHMQMLHLCFTSPVQSIIWLSLSSPCASRLHISFC
jgi:hypothetical protein